MYEALSEIVNNPIQCDDYKILDTLVSVYNQTGYRHSYFELSTYIGRLSPDESDLLEAKLIDLLQISNDNKNYFCIKNSLMKLVDHVSLEGLRISRIKEMEYKSDKIKYEVDDVSKKCEDEMEKIKGLDESVKNIHRDTIAILGIFAGLVIGFMASFELLADSLNAIDEIGFYREIAYFCIIGTIMFDCMFLLIFSVARISGRSLAIRCKKKDCKECGECKFSLKIIRKKYSYVVWYNASMVVAFIICALLDTLK